MELEEQDQKIEERLEWEKLETKIEDVDFEKIEDKTEDKKLIDEESLPSIGEGRYLEGIGRRKEAVARVRIWDNKSDKLMQIFVNNRHYTEYFPALYLQKLVDAPLRKLRIFKKYMVTVKVKGGGLHGQADAIKLGLARALLKVNEEWRPKLKKSGLLTRDPREVERKKYGLKKARRAPQWHKR